MFALPSGLQLGWLIYERARALTGAASHIGSWISLLLTDVDGEVRQLLEQLVHRVDALTPALHYALAWSSDKGSAVSDVVFQAKAELFRVEQFIAMCGRQQGQVKLLDREWLIRHLHLHLRELEFSLSAVNLAVSLINASRPTQPQAAVLSTSALLRASDRLHSMTDTAGDVTCSFGALYMLRTHQHHSAAHNSSHQHSHSAPQRRMRGQSTRQRSGPSKQEDGGVDDLAFAEAELSGSDSDDGGVGLHEDDGESLEMMREEEPLRAAALYLSRSRLPLDASTFLTDVDHFSADPEEKRRKREQEEEQQKDGAQQTGDSSHQHRRAGGVEGGGGGERWPAGASHAAASSPAAAVASEGSTSSSSSSWASSAEAAAAPRLPGSSPPLPSHPPPPVCDVRTSLNSAFIDGADDDDHNDGGQRQPLHSRRRSPDGSEPADSAASSARAPLQPPLRQQQPREQASSTSSTPPLSSAAPSDSTRPTWERMSAMQPRLRAARS